VAVRRRELREWLGISLQETRLSEKLTVRETLQLFSSFYRHPTSLDAVLEELSLQEKADSWVGKLSGGQKQRLAVATALVANLRFSSWTNYHRLDPQSRRQLWDIIRQFQKRNGTVLLTPITWTRRNGFATGSRSSIMARSSAAGTPAELIERLTVTTGRVSRFPSRAVSTRKYGAVSRRAVGPHRRWIILTAGQRAARDHPELLAAVQKQGSH